ICHYDKQQWERSMDDNHYPHHHHNHHNHHSTSGGCGESQFTTKLSVNTFARTHPMIQNDLIDLDLISGSAFTMKSKSQQGWISMLIHAIFRVLFFPLYLNWWSKQTNSQVIGLLFILYCLQLVSIRFYYQKNLTSSSSASSLSNLSDSNESFLSASSSTKQSNEYLEIPSTEILMPIAMMIVLGIIHMQIVGMKNFKSSNSSCHNSNSVCSNSSKISSNTKLDYSKNEINCNSQQTDCSSSSCNCTSSSVDSSPVVNVRRRLNKKIGDGEKFRGNNLAEEDQKIVVSHSRKNYDDMNIKIYQESKEETPKQIKKRKLRNRCRISKSIWDESIDSIPLRSKLYDAEMDDESSLMSPLFLNNNEWQTMHSDATSDNDDDDDNSNGCCNENHDESSKQGTSDDLREDSSKENFKTTERIFVKPENSKKFNSIQSNELKVSCSVWHNNVCQKVDLSVAEISSAIIRKVETIEHSAEYIFLGLMFSVSIALIPSIFRLQFSTKEGLSIVSILNHHNISSTLSFSSSVVSSSNQSTDFTYSGDLFELFNFFAEEAFYINKNSKTRFLIFVAMIERFVLSLLYFFLLCVTERTFKQRFLYSKYFSHLTRRDRAKRSQIPHFRLHKVRNLKIWLSVRSYLRRFGPHRSVDAICSTTFIISICLLTCICLQILKESNESCTSRLICWEMIFWSLALGLYIMRLMILGSRINQKYRSNMSVLITEQINLYLQLERQPHKKDALMLANQVLKLAVDLLKEIESPYKISGFSTNPYLYNIIKVVVLSAFSAVLTEMLGFKLKLYKIKLIR
ncbi:Putative homeodomain transcription factor, partial [Sarcoptes scabiei]